MLAPRIPETTATILSHAHAKAYDRMQAAMRENGQLETEDLLQCGINHGIALEAGSGPGYMGLEWLGRTCGTSLVGLDMSQNMIEIANGHAREFDLSRRAEYFLGSVETMPFENERFDAVFTSRSLHEWDRPREVLSDFWRVLKPGGTVYISDLRRDLSRPAINFLERRMTSQTVLDGLRASIAASYTAPEVADMLAGTKLAGCTVEELPFGLRVTGSKRS
jgi:ubiquinone/menaquinone biosynthesis C-methylase UbiE